MKNSKTSLLFIGFILFVLAPGCSSTKVTRVPIKERIDLSGQWNDTDARMVSEEMIKACLEGRWLSEFHKSHGNNPVVIIGPIVNRSHEHINTDIFTKDLERELINSGKVTFVASKDERIPVRDERQDQHSGLTDPATIKPIGKETGADFMLRGSLNSVKDEIKGKYVILYQVNLELIDLTTNQVTWLDQTELKKSVTHSRFSL